MSLKMLKSILIVALVFTVVLIFSFISCKKNEALEKVITEQNTTGIAEMSEEIISEESTEGADGAEVSESTAAETDESTEKTLQTIKNGEITFKTEDNIELDGNLFGQGAKWVILAHMYPTDQTSWFEFAEELAQKGYVALTFDFRGYGKSEGSRDDIQNIDIDVKAAISYVRQYDYDKLFLIGASMGGTASIIAASENPDLSGVVSLASPDKMGSGLDALAAVSELKMPKIFICAKGDTENAESAKKLYEKAVEPKEIELIDGNAHGTFIFEEEPENAVILKDMILGFLDRN